MGSEMCIRDRRKADGLHVADRIRLQLQVPDDKVEAVRANLEMIKAETLALQADVSGGAAQITVKVEALA